MFKLTDTARRWTGGIFLGISLLMVILGFTVLESRLKDFAYIFYWLVCIAFTFSAATVALLDFSAVRRNAIREQRELIEKTIIQIEKAEQKTRPPSPEAQ